MNQREKMLKTIAIIDLLKGKNLGITGFATNLYNIYRFDTSERVITGSLTELEYFAKGLNYVEK